MHFILIAPFDYRTQSNPIKESKNGPCVGFSLTMITIRRILMTYDSHQSERYWSSFSCSPMFSRFSISFLMPLIQDCASSADSATRSKLPLRPRKTSVKHRSAGNSSAMLMSTSDWWPSRIASTSLTETGHQVQNRIDVYFKYKSQRFK